VALAQESQPVSRLGSLLRGQVRAPARGEASDLDKSMRPWTQAIGRGLVKGMPTFLKMLSVVGMLAMLWVGGGIIIHGLAGFGWAGIEHAIHGVAHTLGGPLPLIGGLVEWLIGATLAGLVGLGIGWVVVKVLGVLGFGHGDHD
jgi:hypothetical protein